MNPELGFCVQLRHVSAQAETCRPAEVQMLRLRIDPGQLKNCLPAFLQEDRTVAERQMAQGEIGAALARRFEDFIDVELEHRPIELQSVQCLRAKVQRVESHSQTARLEMELAGFAGFDQF